MLRRALISHSYTTWRMAGEDELRRVTISQPDGRSAFPDQNERNKAGRTEVEARASAVTALTVGTDTVTVPAGT